MKNGSIKRFRTWLILILVIVAAIAFFFYRMYHSDVKSLNAFTASYENFDRAILDYAANKTTAAESTASAAVANLQTKSRMRISSLIKHDGELMSEARVIANLAKQEFDSVKANTADDFTAQRKSAYAYFQSLE